MSSESVSAHYRAWSLYGAPGCNRWQPLANRPPAKTAKTSGDGMVRRGLRFESGRGLSRKPPHNGAFVSRSRTRLSMRVWVHVSIWAGPVRSWCERREKPARYEEDHHDALPVVRAQRRGRGPRPDARGGYAA